VAFPERNKELRPLISVHAFGTGARDARVTALLDEAAAASGVDLSKLVDEILYVQGASSFEVIGGRRVLAIGSNAFGRTRAGQLVEAAHEIAHAQYFDRYFARRLGFTEAVEEYFSLERSFGTPLYAREEVLVERLAQWRISHYLGGLAPQQSAASTRYINGWLIIWRP